MSHEEHLLHIAKLYSLLRQKGIGVAKLNKLLSSGGLFLEFSGNSEQYSISEIPKLRKIPVDVSTDFMAIDVDSRYPVKLKKDLGFQAPPVLAMAGNVELLQSRLIGFGGSRKVSAKGLEIARDCANIVANAGNTVVSGYASGVDVASHRAALECGGNTIIVLPQGMDGFYIRSELKDVWDWNRVLVISEFLPEEPWSASRAMKRNGTIVSLCEAMMIIEAGEKGGSMDAGLRTLQAKKPLYVPEFAIYQESSAGNPRLIKAGAIPVRRSRTTSKPNIQSLI